MTVPDAPDAIALGFVGRLRDAGVPVGLGDAILFVDALARLGMGARTSVYWAGKITLVKQPGDLARYDECFASYWDAGVEADAVNPMAVPVGPSPIGGPDQDTVDSAPGARGDTDDTGDTGDTIAARASAVEVLRHKDFGAYTDEERRQAHRLVTDLRIVAATRRSRRRRPARSTHGRRLDLRRSVRTALKHDGEVVRRHTTESSTRPRRIVLLCDVSGSMEPYARTLLRFAQAAMSSPAPVEVFTFGTRLTRISRELANHDPDDALARAALAVHDWSGGTRLGENLRRFNDEWGMRGMARGAVVVIVSDGWECGEPDDLAEQMARLSRVAHRVVWVNPLKASPGYEPLARGMASALPFIDRFVEGHSLVALDRLAVEMSRED
jgi:uncharacterized protein with von Willebrand factor type A (vWA) domain